jgi:hypothetical protein
MDNEEQKHTHFSTICFSLGYDFLEGREKTTRGLKNVKNKGVLSWLARSGGQKVGE